MRPTSGALDCKQAAAALGSLAGVAGSHLRGIASGVPAPRLRRGRLYPPSRQLFGRANASEGE